MMKTELGLDRRDMRRDYIEDDDDMECECEPDTELTSDKVWKALDTNPADPSVRDIIKVAYEAAFTNRVAKLDAGAYAREIDLQYLRDSALDTVERGRISTLNKRSCKEGRN